MEVHAIGMHLISFRFSQILHTVDDRYDNEIHN